LAKGNGLYDLEGIMTLSPVVETSGTRYIGPPRGSDRKVLGSPAALKSEVERLRQNFSGRSSWIKEAIAQLKEQEAGGWGQNDKRVSLPAQSVILAASQACPSCQGAKMMTCTQCNGQGAIICPQCGGRRQEICPICNGMGDNPSQPGQVCINCNGLRYVACRYCHGGGQLTCPTCQGRRGIPCPACKGSGVITEEINVTCGARTSFHIKGENLPSGLRRGLDRLGMERLAKGHADIESVELPPDENEVDQPPPMPGETAPQEKAPKPELRYAAHIPYADLRMTFGGKRTIVGIFGKRNVLLDVPSFLDVGLEQAREALASAAKGGGGFEEALDKRAMQDALRLQLVGKGKVEEMRRLYPYGMSTTVAEEILSNMRLALNRATLRWRSMAAVGLAVVGLLALWGIFDTSVHGRLPQSLNPYAILATDFGILAVVMAACWFTLSSVTRLVLQKRFPEIRLALTQKTGKTGYSMLAALMVGYVILLVFAPQKTWWVQALMNLHIK
jgi:hypothetical protein